MKMTRIVTAALVAVSWSSFASAAFMPLYFEVEPNGTIPDAIANNDIGTAVAPGGGSSIEGFLDSGDVDWYAFSVAGAAYIGAAAFDNGGVGADAMFQLIDITGGILAFDDDSGVGLMPALDATIPAGTYLLGISAYADVTSSVGLTELFDGIDNVSGGPTSADFTYKISIIANVVPEPVGLTLALLGGAMLFARRRR